MFFKIHKTIRSAGEVFDSTAKVTVVPIANTVEKKVHFFHYKSDIYRSYGFTTPLAGIAVFIRT